MRGMKAVDFKERMKVTNASLVNSFFEQGKSVMVLTMHYNNWEWGTYLSVYLKHKSLAVYKPLHDVTFDKFLNQTRTKYGTELIKNDQILRRVLQAEKQNEPVFIWLAGDQTPPVFHKFWFRFLNQDALFYPGPAVISKRFNQPVFFQNIKKTGRGKYETTFEMLFENPAKFSETEIIKTYIQRMEEVIREKPEFYLWSHKRWKHKRPADLPLQN
jgi:KDO2-lipid IV(A) lauroyltransferase